MSTISTLSKGHKQVLLHLNQAFYNKRLHDPHYHPSSKEAERVRQIHLTEASRGEVSKLSPMTARAVRQVGQDRLGECETEVHLIVARVLNLCTEDRVDPDHPFLKSVLNRLKEVFDKDLVLDHDPAENESKLWAFLQAQFQKVSLEDPGGVVVTAGEEEHKVFMLFSVLLLEFHSHAHLLKDGEREELSKEFIGLCRRFTNLYFDSFFAEERGSLEAEYANIREMDASEQANLVLDYYLLLTRCFLQDERIKAEVSVASEGEGASAKVLLLHNLMQTSYGSFLPGLGTALLLRAKKIQRKESFQKVMKIASGALSVLVANYSVSLYRESAKTMGKKIQELKSDSKLFSKAHYLILGGFKRCIYPYIHQLNTNRQLSLALFGALTAILLAGWVSDNKYAEKASNAVATGLETFLTINMLGKVISMQSKKWAVRLINFLGEKCMGRFQEKVVEHLLDDKTSLNELIKMKRFIQSMRVKD
ncbi:MAG: hypothetical protein GWP59_02365 [Chlamydiales bacterium]|nr:hypothetical protein [Chlamydiales bacterium]